MKKVFAIVLVIAVIAAGGWLLYTQVIANPERLIVGEWQSTDDFDIDGVAGFTGYEFDKEGKVTLKAKVLVDVTYDGTYTIDKENDTIKLSYKILGVGYDKEFTYEFDGDSLTLSPQGSDSVYSFARVEK